MQSVKTKLAGETCKPVSIGQEGFLFLHEFFPDDQLFNIGLRLHIRGLLDEKALQCSLDALVGRHELLRTSFHRGAEGVFAKEHATSQQALRHVDLSRCDGASRGAQLEVLEREELFWRFELDQLPLLRVTLIKIGRSEHVLLLVLHHIVADGTSFFGHYLDELEVLYNAFCNGEGSPLEPVETGFEAFVDWQRGRNEGQHLARRLTYWRKHLAGAPASIDLPRRSAASSKRTAVAGRIEHSPSMALGRRIDALAEGLGVWPSTILFGAYYVLAGRYARQSDLVIGNHLANRKGKKLARVFGPLVNVVPTRFQLRDGESFGELAKRLQSTVLGSAINGDVALERIVEDIGSGREAGNSQLHQIGFNYMASGFRDHDWNGASVTVDRIFPDATYLDLILVATRSKTGLILSAEFKTEVYEASMVDRFLMHYFELLTSAVEEPEREAVGLPFLTQDECSDLLVEFNRSERAVPEVVGVHELFAERARETPDAIAVEFQDTRLTYRELDEKANQLAHEMQTRGAGPEKLVGLCLDRSQMMTVAVLACFKVGAAYLPLDPSYPLSRLRYMIDDSGINLLLSDESSLARLDSPALDTILLDSDWEEISGRPVLPPTVEHSRDLLAYVIYTSGSTGKPKGVEVTHDCLLNFVVSMAETPGFTRDDRLLSVTTLSFDIAGLELYLPLTRGGTVILAGQDVVADGARLLELLRHSKPTVMQATPSTWYLLLQAGWMGTPGLKVLCGGEAMPGELARELFERVESLWNMYGPTETTIWSSCQEITNPDLPIRIGRPIANTQFYVLDPAMQPVPFGVPGELHIGGRGVARGYLHRPELTRERFVTNPFLGGDSQERMYRTGDLVRVHSDGVYECLRRLDSQVKLRGYRIELGEIESALSAQADVDRAVAIVWEVTPEDKRLVAYVIPKAGGTLEIPVLRDALLGLLPAYMVPQHIVVIDDFPQTPNGKVDRKALPRPELGAGVAERRGPRDDLELRIAAIWQELLGFPEIAIDDVFFEIGGRSLLAIQLVSRLNQEFDSEMGLATLFENPTIQQLADVLRAGCPESGPLVVPLQPKGDKAPLFCLCGVHLYFPLAKSLDPDRPVYGVFLPPEEEFRQANAAKALRSGEGSSTVVSQLATRYKEEIQSVQPEGPYHLAGVCFGGLLAYEVGRQLRSAGERVESVVIMETVMGTSLQFSWLRWIVGHVRKVLRVGPGYAWASLIRRASRLRRGSGDREIELAADEAAHEQVAGAAYIQAMREHDEHMEPYAGTILFIRASNPPDMLGYKIPPGGGFKALASGGIVIREAPGDHLGILGEDNVPHLVSIIRDYMDSDTSGL